MNDLRFQKLSDDELYILKRCIIEAKKYIYMDNRGNYTDEEHQMMTNLLNEIIENVKHRDENM